MNKWKTKHKMTTDRMELSDGSTVDIAVIRSDQEGGCMFTVSDWQGVQPDNIGEAGDFKWWQVAEYDPANTDLWRGVIMLDGLPYRLI